MSKQQFFTRQQVILLIDNMLEHADAVADAIQNEDPKLDGEGLLELSESSIDSSIFTHTGIVRIAYERNDQIEKHGNTPILDRIYNNSKELSVVARELLQQHPSVINMPESWRQNNVTHKMAGKNYSDRLVIAGALICAELDRINTE